MNEVDAHKLNEALSKDTEEDGIDFINVCSPAEYKDKCIPGIRNIPLSKIKDHLDEFKEMETIYVHCTGGKRGAEAIKKLKELGITAEMYNLSGGLMAWEEAGYGTVSNRTGMPLMRQVLLVAGLLIIIGYVLSFVNPMWFLLPLFVGIGLTVSGATGWCGMMTILTRMPWNK